MNKQNPIILCVDNEETNLKLLENILVPRGYAVVCAANGADALLKIKSQTIDLVLLDILMPRMDGFEVCRQIKADEKLRNIPVIMITVLTAKQDRIRGIEAGAEEFLSKPFDQLEVLARIKLLLKVKELYDDRERAEEEVHRAKASVEEAHRELQQAFVREQHLARTDALTGVNNRRYWFELAEHEFEVATRYRRPLSVILFDIDNFKFVNDTFGHAVGDQILERVTQAARAAPRSVDVIGRYGGDEFVIMLPMTTAPQAYPVAERIRARVGAIRVLTPKGDVAVTLSIGIAEKPLAPPTERPGGDDSVERVIHCADEAMYAAKAAGRNRTSTFSAPAERPGGSA